VLAVGAVAPLSAHAAADGWWHTSGSRIVAADGSTVTIKAANWFGLETPNCAPHGLWSITLDEGLAQIAAMGFNTVRLPYSNQCLAASTTSSIDASRNPDLVSLTPLQLMDAVIAKARAHGLRVILDRHRIESSGQSELWYTSTYSEKRWIDDWVMLANRYRDDPTVVGADLHNEPHGSACWGCGDTSRDWQAAATRAGNAVLAANPTADHRRRRGAPERCQHDLVGRRPEGCRRQARGARDIEPGRLFAARVSRLGVRAVVVLGAELPRQPAVGLGRELGISGPHRLRADLRRGVRHEARDDE
jgi:hypothetical protein